VVSPYAPSIKIQVAPTVVWDTLNYEKHYE
jgi:hypothetical protein